MFESEFAKTEYIEKDGAVFHVWKKEAHFDDYRKPVIASLELLRDHKDSIFILETPSAVNCRIFDSMLYLSRNNIMSLR